MRLLLLLLVFAKLVRFRSGVLGTTRCLPFFDVSLFSACFFVVAFRECTYWTDGIGVIALMSLVILAPVISKASITILSFDTNTPFGNLLPSLCDFTASNSSLDTLEASCIVSEQLYRLKALLTFLSIRDRKSASTIVVIVNFDVVVCETSPEVKNFRNSTFSWILARGAILQFFASAIFCFLSHAPQQDWTISPHIQHPISTTCTMFIPFYQLVSLHII